MRVLVVEDDRRLADELCRSLEEYGVAADHVVTGEAAVVEASMVAFNVVILDITLAGPLDGFGVCAELRRRRVGAGVLMLTARDTVAERVRGLNTGADDYLAKPFAFQELLARVRALARRHLDDRAAVLRAGNISIDTLAHTATVGDLPMRLSRKEHVILQALLHGRGRLVTRQEVHDRSWNYRFTPQSNLVDVYVARLRRKLEALGADHVIVTERGLGYRLEPVAGTPVQPRGRNA